MPTIGTEDVQRLLEADEDAVLVLIAGQPRIVDQDDDSGGLYVMSRRELVERGGVDGANTSDAELERLSAMLSETVDHLGG